MQAATIAELKEAAPTSAAARKRLRRAKIHVSITWPCHPDHIVATALHGKHAKLPFMTRRKFHNMTNRHGESRTKCLQALGMIAYRHKITDDHLVELLKIAKKHGKLEAQRRQEEGIKS